MAASRTAKKPSKSKSKKKLVKTQARKAKPKSTKKATAAAAAAKKPSKAPKAAAGAKGPAAPTGGRPPKGKAAVPQGRIAVKGAAAKTRGGRSAGSEAKLEFEAGRAPGRAAHETRPAPAPRRRSSARPGSPDWPGENLTVGMDAPDFSLPSTLDRKLSLGEFKGKQVVLYFYPKDDTPGCTMEACQFRDNMARIESKEAVVLGISLDDEMSHKRFGEKYNLPFPLLSDVDALVSRQYGVYKEKTLYGRSFWGIERTTFVIDREGKVENVFRRVKVEGHADEVLATLSI